VITENFTSKDIEFLCDEASRTALKQKRRISKEIILETIKNNKPSITLKELNSYIAIKAKLEGEQPSNNKRTRIGFN